MGIYLNPGRQRFQMSINSEIFVDKTEMISDLNLLVNTQQRFISVSRPRRFGKTMAADMICAYYDRKADSRNLFENMLLASNCREEWDRYLGQFDVIRLVMTDFIGGCNSAAEMLQNLTDEVSEELIAAYPGIDSGSRISLRTLMSKIYNQENRQFVVVIDEWDAIFRVLKEDSEGQKAYLDFLRDWLKDKPYIALAYMTGILPIKRYGEHSALNMFDDYSMMQPMSLARYTGFTVDEVRELCSEYEMNYEEISDWYDGYTVSDSVPVAMRKAYREGTYTGNQYQIYSPLSVVKSMREGRIRNYWNKTETYEALAEYIRKDFDGLKESVALLMDGGRLRIDPSTYQNDMTTFHSRDDILTLLIHLGYLSYDSETDEVFIPNREILDEFRTSTKSSEWSETFKAFETSQKLLEATWECDEERVAELVEYAHNRAGNRTYNDEAALSYGIQLAYYAAQKYYTTVLELDSGKGYADIAYLPSPKYSDKPALLIELKVDSSPEDAIAQIHRQKYLDRFEHYKGNTIIIGISYLRDLSNTDPDFKRHSCRIEKA